LKFYQVAITGIVQVGEGEPSPITWAWSPENLADRLREDMEHIDIEFREMILAPNTGDFVLHGDHNTNCKWPDDTCSCQG
jgi:hypothetical protein